jgi:hypothetical protein
MNPVMRLCPRCKMVSYVSTMTWDSTCPHCSFHIGHWMNRRSSARREIRYNIKIEHKDLYLSGTALDYSDGGMKISYEGNPLIPGDRILIRVKELAVNGSAEIKWLQPMEDTVVIAGIEIICSE